MPTSAPGGVNSSGRVQEQWNVGRVSSPPPPPLSSPHVRPPTLTSRKRSEAPRDDDSSDSSSGPMRFTPPTKKREIERVLRETLSEMSSVPRAGPSSGAEASTSSGLTALDLLKRQRDMLEEEIRRQQRDSEAAKGKSVVQTTSQAADPPAARPVDTAPRCEWEENKDLSAEQFYSKYFDKGMPEGSKSAPEGCGSGGFLEKLPTDLRMRIGRHLDEESPFELQRTNRDARYRLFGGK